MFAIVAEKVKVDLYNYNDNNLKVREGYLCCLRAGSLSALCRQSAVLKKIHKIKYMYAWCNCKELMTVLPAYSACNTKITLKC